MKNIIFLICIGFVICTAFIIPPTDYRDTYVGTYFCSSKCQSLNSNYSSINYYNDTITISVTKNIADSILNISIHGIAHPVKLKNGKMYSYQPGTQNQGKFFSTDSIAFSISANHVPNGCSYKGKKQ